MSETAKLVAEQVEVHPRRGTASLGTAEKTAVEFTSLGDIANLNSDVKRGKHGRPIRYPYGAPYWPAIAVASMSRGPAEMLTGRCLLY